MDVSPDMYRQRVLRHLTLHRPKELARLRAQGNLGEHVDDLAMQIANWVNSQLKGQDERLVELGFEEKIRVQASERMMHESDAIREILPMDEVTDPKIGPSGGYED